MVQQEGQFPPPNEVLERRRISQEMNNHKKRLLNARPAIDTRSPPLYLHLHVKLKKLQIESDRRKEIHSENMRLLERMNQIMERSPPYEDKLKNRGRRSLNIQKIREEQQKIMQENRILFQKLLKAEPGCYCEKRPRSCKTAVSSGKNCRNPSHIKKIGGAGNFRNKLSAPESCEVPLSRDGLPIATGLDVKDGARRSQKKSDFTTKRHEYLQNVSSKSKLLNAIQEKGTKGQTRFPNAERTTDEIFCQRSAVGGKSKLQVTQKVEAQPSKRNIKSS